MTTVACIEKKANMRWIGPTSWRVLVFVGDLNISYLRIWHPKQQLHIVSLNTDMCLNTLIIWLFYMSAYSILNTT